jgi:chromosome segregation ATPase
MSKAVNLRPLDSAGNIMTQPCKMAGHDRAIRDELQMELSHAVNGYFQKLKQAGIFDPSITRSADIDFNVIEHPEEGEIEIRANKRVCRIDAETDLGQEGVALIKDVKAIWNKHLAHTPHSRKHAPSLRDRSIVREVTPPLDDELDTVGRRQPRRRDVPHEIHGSRRRDRFPQEDDFERGSLDSDLTPQRRRSHEDVSDVASDRLIPNRKLFTDGLALCEEARKLIEDYGQGRPCAHRALGLAHRLNQHILQIQSSRRHQESQDLADLEDQLKFWCDSVKAITEDRQNLGEFSEIFNTLMPATEAEDVEFHEILEATQREHPGPLFDSIMEQTRHYLERMHPDYGRLDFTPGDRKLALKYALMRQFAIYSTQMSSDNSAKFAELFGKLNRQDVHDILDQYQPDSDSLEASYRAFFAVNPKNNIARSDAIIRWIDVSINQGIGEEIGALRERVDSTSDELARMRDSVGELERDRDVARDRVVVLEAEIDELERLKDTANERAEELEAQYVPQLEDLSARVEELTHQLNLARLQGEENGEQIERLQADLEDAQGKLIQAKAFFQWRLAAKDRIATKALRREQLKSLFARYDAQHQKRQANRFAALYEHASGRVEELEELLRAKTDEASRLQLSLHEATEGFRERQLALSSELEQIASEARRLGLINGEQERLIASLKDSLAGTKREAREGIEQLRAQHAADLRELQTKVIDPLSRKSQATAEELERTALQLQHATHEFEEQRQLLSSEIRDLRVTNEELGHTIDAAREDARVWKERYEQETAALKAELEKQRQAHLEASSALVERMGHLRADHQKAVIFYRWRIAAQQSKLEKLSRALEDESSKYQRADALAKRLELQLHEQSESHERAAQLAGAEREEALERLRVALREREQQVAQLEPQLLASREANRQYGVLVAQLKEQIREIKTALGEQPKQFTEIARVQVAEPLENIIRGLQRDLQAIKERHEDLQRAKSLQEHQFEEQRDALSLELRRACEARDSAILNIESNRRELSATIDDLRDQNRKLQARIDHLESVEIAGLRDELSAQRKENLRIQGLLDKALEREDAANREVASLRLQLQSRAEIGESELSGLRSELAAALRDQKLAVSQVRDLEQANERLTRESSVLEKQLRARISELEESLRVQLHGFEEERSQWTNRKRALDERIEELSGLLSAKTDEARRLALQVEELQAAARGVPTKLEDAERRAQLQITQLQDELGATIDEQKDTISELERTAKLRDAELLQLREKAKLLVSVTDDRDAKARELLEALKRIATLESQLKAQTQQWQQALKERDDEIARLRLLNKQVSSANDSLLSSGRELERRVSLLEREKAQALELASGKDKEIGPLQARVLELEKLLDAERRAHAGCEPRIRELAERNAQLGLELEHALRDRVTIDLTRRIDPMDLAGRMEAINRWLEEHPAQQKNPYLEGLIKHFPEILGGSLDAMAQPSSERMLAIVEEALKETLALPKDHPHRGEWAANLAIYIANYDPAIIRDNADSFAPLVELASEERLKGPIAAAKYHTLALALSRPGLICGPLHAAMQGTDLAVAIRTPDVELDTELEHVVEPCLSTVNAATKGGLRVNAQELRNTVRDAIVARLQHAGLGWASETCVEHLARTVVRTGNLPSVFQKVLCQENPNELLVVAQLLYDYVALSTKPKAGYEDIATHSSLKWLTNGTSPQKGSALLFRLMHEIHDSTDFRPVEQPWAYPITKQQAAWIENICNLMNKGSGDNIYAEAGSGKTTTAAMAIRFCQRHLNPDSRVFFMSPFAKRDVHQFLRDQRDIEIDVTEEEFAAGVAIVDEGHLLHPDAKIILKHDGQRREASFIQMTATPVIPQSQYETFKREVLFPQYLEEFRAIEEELAKIDEEADRLVALHESKITERAIANLERVYAEKAKVTKGDFRQRRVNALIHLARNKRPGHPLRAEDYAAALQIIFTPTNARHLAPLETAVSQMSTLWPKMPADVSYEAMMIKALLANDADNPDVVRAINDVLDLLNPANVRRTRQRILAQVGVKIAERRRWLEGKREALATKLDNWEHAHDTNDDTYKAVQLHMAAAFKRIAYTQAPESTDLRVAARFSADQIKPSRTQVVQAIFPGLRFAADTFDTFVQELARRHEGPISFVFQDSHSADGNRGKKRVYSFSREGVKTTHDLAGWNPSADERVVILYDETNMQGGDFEPHSRASAEHEVEQFIFCNIHGEDVPNRSERLSENDMLQAQRRRRGESQLRSYVYGTQASPELFLRQTAANQKALEQHWALRDTAERIARKTLKSMAMIRTAASAYDESSRGAASYDRTHNEMYTGMYHKDFERQYLSEYTRAAQDALRAMRKDRSFAQTVQGDGHFSPVMTPAKEDGTTLWRVAKNRQEIEHHAEWFRDLGQARPAPVDSSL